MLLQLLTVHLPIAISHAAGYWPQQPPQQFRQGPNLRSRACVLRISVRGVLNGIAYAPVSHASGVIHSFI